MLNILKRNKKNDADIAPEKPNLFARLRQGLSKTRAGLAEGFARLIAGKKQLDHELLDQIETSLLCADTGVATTQHLINHLTDKLSRHELADAEAALAALQTEMKNILEPCRQPLVIPESTKPFVILVVGVNGSGKTTTIGKLAAQLKAEGKTVMLAAGDTFRAAAIEQLQVWGQRNDIPVIAQQNGVDPAAVLHDALSAATSRGIDVLIADTAGRLHTQNHLMEELKKIRRVLAKIDPSAPHETLLVLDAGIGQNTLNQANQFLEAIGVTGLVLTKLDGTAKGGIVFAIARELSLPVRFIGVGENVEDLRPFDPEAFVAALFEPAS